VKLLERQIFPDANAWDGLEFGPQFDSILDLFGWQLLVKFSFTFIGGMGTIHCYAAYSMLKDDT
jgi:hypothetical protein